MGNKDSENLIGFTVKAVLITGVIVVIVRLLINSHIEASNQSQDTNNGASKTPENVYIEEDNYENNVVYDNRVPICSANPDGAKVLPGTGYLFGAEEHINCKDYCLIDREKELTNKLEAKRREQSIKSLEQQLNQ